ncbi:MAG: NYN domain-containing protein [Syntrophaceae bacterium]|nr:NYN domain-containing protein [Syntrophaceae bacterium]
MNNANDSAVSERVQVYVDGFNLYFGMLDAGIDKGKWLNVKLLAENLLKPNQHLSDVHYFTSRVSNDPDKQKRQSTYIEALESVGVRIHYGHYQSGSVTCKRCQHLWATYNEKMTDVNIATRMLIDAYQDRYDMAMLISGDSDLVPPIRAVHDLFPSKRVFVAFPPKRHNQTIAICAKGSMTIGRRKIIESQFPETVQKNDSFILSRPNEWL